MSDSSEMFSSRERKLTEGLIHAIYTEHVFIRALIIKTKHAVKSVGHNDIMLLTTMYLINYQPLFNVQ